VPARLPSDGAKGDGIPGSAPTALLDALDRALRAFVTARPEVAVALLADESSASARVPEAEALTRQLEAALTQAASALRDPALLFVQAGRSGHITAEICIAAPDPQSVVERFYWPCAWRSAAE